MGTIQSLSKYKVVNCKILNLRNSPSINATIGGKLKVGKKVQVVDGYKKRVVEYNNKTHKKVVHNFLKVKIGNEYYYAVKKYLIECDRAARVVKAAKMYSHEMLNNNWYYHNARHGSGNTFTKAKKNGKGGSCGYFVSWCLQYAGVIGNGKVVSHTSAGHKPSSASNVILNKGNIKHGKVIFPVNKSIKSYKKKLKAGDIIIHDSSIEVYIGVINGKPTVISGRNGSTLSNGKYVKMKLTSGYEFTHNIYAIIRPLG